MSQINNTELLKELKDGIKLNQLTDFAPNQLADKVVPVMEVNPKMLKYANYVNRISSAVTGTTTLNLPAGIDFYLTGLSFNASKNAACDMISVYVAATPYGLPATRLIDVTCQTLTLNDSINIQKDYTYPIRLIAGSTITLVKAFAAGAAGFSVTITGYTVENSNA